MKWKAYSQGFKEELFAKLGVSQRQQKKKKKSDGDYGPPDHPACCSSPAELAAIFGCTGLLHGLWHQKRKEELTQPLELCTSQVCATGIERKKTRPVPLKVECWRYTGKKTTGRNEETCHKQGHKSRGLSLAPGWGAASEVQEWRPLVAAPRSRAPRGHLLLMALRWTDGLGLCSSCSAQHAGWAGAELSHLSVVSISWQGNMEVSKVPSKKVLTSSIPSPLKFNDFLSAPEGMAIVVSPPRFLYIWYTCTLRPSAASPPPGFTLGPAFLPVHTHPSENSVSPFSSNLHRHSSQVSSSRPEFAM